MVSNGKLFACVKGGYDFVDVRDVAKGVTNACKNGIKGECYILSNRYITIKELCDLICDLQKRKRIKIILPISIAKLIAPLFELYYNLKKNRSKATFIFIKTFFKEIFYENNLHQTAKTYKKNLKIIRKEKLKSDRKNNKKYSLYLKF